jgi:putative peptidoglycan lipid II flippase
MTGPDRRPPEVHPTRDGDQHDNETTMIIRPVGQETTAVVPPAPIDHDATMIIAAVGRTPEHAVNRPQERTPDRDATVIIPRVPDAMPAAELEAAAERTAEPAEGASRGAAGNSAVMAVGSLVSRGTGFLRTAVITAAVGGAAIGNAYTTAQIFPGMVYELLLGGILSSVLVPMLVRSRKSDADRGEAFTQRLLTLTVVVLGITTVLATVAAPLLTFVYASKNGPEFRGLVTALSYLMLPTIFFYGLAGVCSAVLNTRGKFAAPMWAPILNNIVVIATGVLYVVLFGTATITIDQMTPARIAVLGGGVLLGIVAQALGLLPSLRQVGFRWRWRFDFRELGLRRLARVGGWMFCYVIVNQAALLVLTNLLNQAGHEDPDAAGTLIFNNVYLLMMMAHGIVVVSIITALLPRMSAAAADGRARDIVRDLSRGVRMVVVVLVPLTACYVVLALPISISLFRWGAFTQEQAVAAAPVLVVAGLALIPFAVSQLFNFTYYSMQDTRTPALINIPVASLRVSVQLAWFAAAAAATIAIGMMIGNAISYMFAAIFSAVLLRRRIGAIGLSEIVVTLAKSLAAGIVAAAAGWFAVDLIYQGATPMQVGKGQALIAMVLGGLVICGVYGAAALLLRVREVHSVLGMVRGRLGR